MPGLTYYVNVTVTKEGVRVSSQALGVPMFLTAHSVTANRADSYESLAEMVTDGWLTTDEGYKWAQAEFSQDLTPATIMIGRIDGGDANITASIQAVADADNDFYLVNIESRADADLTDIALWTESQEKYFVGQTADPDILTGTPGNIAAVLKALSYKRTALLYHALDAEYADGAWTARCGAADLDAAGSVLTWANKSLSGVTVNDLLSGAVQNVRDEGANIFHKVTSANNVTTPGQAIIGTEWIDTQTTLDWTFFRVTEAIFGVLIGTSTAVAFTQAGIDLFVGALQSVLDRGVVIGHFSPDQATTATGPEIAKVSSADKEARILRDLQGTALLRGAIHQVIVNVKVTA